MRSRSGVFSPRERQVALAALVIAGLIAMVGMWIQPMLRPSVGPGGADAYLSAPIPGVLDATPLTS